VVFLFFILFCNISEVCIILLYRISLDSNILNVHTRGILIFIIYVLFSIGIFNEVWIYYFLNPVVKIYMKKDNTRGISDAIVFYGRS